MKVKYRVDRSPSKTEIPSGMNTILYFGHSLRAAQRVFRDTSPGIDHWGNVAPNYGVILSVYDPISYGEFVKYSKGF